MTTFADRLTDAVLRRETPVLVGLDPRFAQLPDSLTKDLATDDWPAIANAYVEFCKGVIDVVAPLVPAVKPQAAFFEQIGPTGMTALANVIAYAQDKGLLVILDGKRNDIGSTATAYADGLLGPGGTSPWGADALTVSPYLGQDSLEPFVDVARDRGAGVFCLVKTSNPGGGLFQDLVVDGQPVYRYVAELVQQLAAETKGDCGYGAVGAVVGATYPEQLPELRAAMPSAWLLVPGYGSQGGAAADVVGAFDENGLGGIINNSRAIIFAYRRPEFEEIGKNNWQDAVEAATKQMILELDDAGITPRAPH